MSLIKKDDIVQVICGKDKGKNGKVLKVLFEQDKAIVEGINFVKKHMRRTQENQKGGVVERESLIHLSNLLAFCRQCNKPVRLKTRILKDKTKTRICVKCKNAI